MSARIVPYGVKDGRNRGDSMIRLENLEVYNLGRAIYSARNPMNSWGKSDSDIENDVLGGDVK